MIQSFWTVEMECTSAVGSRLVAKGKGSADNEFTVFLKEVKTLELLGMSKHQVS